MKNTIETYIVDAFTTELFKGNPAGVCIVESAINEDKMQLIAKELGLSETAFIQEDRDLSEYSIRFFSPKTEIPLCGHATLASSKIVFEKHPALNEIRFTNIQGLALEIRRQEALIEMVFPVYDTEPQSTPEALSDALGIDKIINSEYNHEMKILLIEIGDAILLSQLSPDFEQLKKSHHSINGVLVTATSQRDDFDFESRHFWPWSGTNEDPVTGATHTFLTKYWSSRLNKKKMRSFQCSERTGFMEVELISNDKMTIRSTAQIIFRGELKYK
ncbi:PhzF family phenazine biosynthesis protein [Fulvivirga sp. M361]|uniref:PhzF family phenazine biosynthesis protein n=1 Tax=Fulvivirga sp. M361 TaxID=2594266 RepID=UPI00117B8375|nr:PhzF family phenazine biosynthesis isomerase [Fulvivirga sp. M361]TRX47098.1 PhzF family phenazine biosynthesis protein [Fulvivirga sp. M361]